VSIRPSIHHDARAIDRRFATAHRPAMHSAQVKAALIDCACT
jgi:hypothetical protein